MERTLNILKALADRNRLRIVLALQGVDELCACQVTELLQVAGATVSRHLALLVNAGLLENRKEGRWVFHRLKVSEDNRQVLQWVAASAEGMAEAASDRRAIREIVACDPAEICRRQRGEACCPEKRGEEVTGMTRSG